MHAQKQYHSYIYIYNIVKIEQEAEIQGWETV